MLAQRDLPEWPTGEHGHHWLGCPGLRMGGDAPQRCLVGRAEPDRASRMGVPVPQILQPPSGLLVGERQLFLLPGGVWNEPGRVVFRVRAGADHLADHDRTRL